MMLTAEYVTKLLDYDPDTGVFTWKVTLGSRAKAGDKAGSPNAKGYWTIRINRKLYYAHRLAWLVMTGSWPTSQIDHEDKIKHHNWWSNLRLATNQQNHGNLFMYANNTSGTIGVAQVRKKWVAYLTVNGKKKHLGTFDSRAQASAAYRAAAKAHFGVFFN